MSGKDAKVPALEVIEFDGSESIATYASVSRDLAWALCMEYEGSSDELYAVLCEMGEGHPLAFGLDVKWRARRVCKRLDRMAEMAAGLAVESVKLNLEYCREFAELVKPVPKRQRKWDW
ncbi:hypothetical protein [Sphaerisporangium sp. TRM90804]|uniref:hypothetical protein n=1 Tax=Sphaerisporangium sp. TRM90804 TaxID=3031113 RepID=UPI0024484FEA|nr:hypothetical protein [Sphaerisporangium sp. TRM90804]MDH2429297.1 hypothetical protein [Sphaerisporangium sp. TRM90804]